MALIAAVTLSVSCGGAGSGDSTDNGGVSAAPHAPSRITATEGEYNTSVKIVWDAADGAEYYVIYKSVDNKDQFRVVASNIKTLYYVDNKVTPNRIYYYKVAAGSGTSWSSPSIDARGFAHTGKPFSPERVTASSDKIGYITIDWSSVPQTDSFKIMRGESPEGSYTEIAADLPPIQTEYKDESSLTRDKKYYYQVIAINSEGESEPCEPVHGIALQEIPAVPTDLTATNGTYGNKVEVRWNTSENAVTYNIYRTQDEDDSQGEYTIIAENITELLFEDVTALPDVTYYYIVTALSSGGESDRGIGVPGKIDSGAPIQTAAPVNVSASDGNCDTVTVTWSAVNNSYGYSVYRCETINGTYTRVSGVNKISDTSFIDTPPALVTHYFYKVTAWSSGNDSVESYKSISDEGYAMPQIPSVPAGLSATTNRTDASIIITWSGSARAESYRLYRAESPEGTYNLIASGISELTYTDEYPSISVGKNYYYKVTSVNVSGESGQSSYATGNTIFTVPGGLTLNMDKTNKCVIVTWTGVPGAVSYRIQRRKTLVSSWSTIGTTEDETYSDSSGLTKLIVHYYRVQAFNEASTSSYTSAEDIYVIW
jgi:fibronectin type 3 domain-containing protein